MARFNDFAVFSTLESGRECVQAQFALLLFRSMAADACLLENGLYVCRKGHASAGGRRGKFARIDRGFGFFGRDGRQQKGSTNRNQG
jgi:hypothetical protein